MGSGDDVGDVDKGVDDGVGDWSNKEVGVLLSTTDSDDRASE